MVAGIRACGGEIIFSPKRRKDQERFPELVRQYNPEAFFSVANVHFPSSEESPTPALVPRWQKRDAGGNCCKIRKSLLSLKLETGRKWKTELSKILQVQTQKPHSIDKRESFRLFDRIARSYDFLNHLLSAGQDILWRKKAVQFIPKRSSLTVLDVASGTGDLLLAALDAHRGNGLSGFALDPATEMLKIGLGKAKKRGFQDRVLFAQGDAMALPLPDCSVDAAMIAFGIRNVADYRKGLREMLRVLRPGGRAIVLEFSLPEQRIFRQLYLFYFRHVLPVVGGILSGDLHAYRYLNATVEAFPYGRAFCRELEAAGFGNVRHFPLTFGIATIYLGDKEEAPCGD